MKKRIFGIFIRGIIFILLFSMCATTGEKHDPGEAYLLKHFINEYDKDIGFYILKGLNGEEFHSITVPSNIKGKPVRIAEKAFYQKKIKSVKFLPDGKINIGNEAFANNEITEVVIPDSINMIGKRAFANNKITNVVISEGIKILSEGVFANNALTNVNLPASLEVIEIRAFENNALTEINISEKIRDIGERAFAKNKINSVVIPASVKRFGMDVFAENNFQQPFVLPDSVNEISSSLVTGMIQGTGSNRTITVKNGVINNNGINIPSAMYGIPVTNIAKGFFAGTSGGAGLSGYLDRDKRRKKINNLVLPTSLTAIEFDAFAFCDIVKVTAPSKTVQDIWDDYIKRQNEADELIYKKEYNSTVNQMQGMFR